MRAVVVRNYGGPEALEVIDVPDPETSRGQVRIRVEAAAVNPVDVATRQGLMNEARPGVIRERDHVGIGWDVAGTVEAAGSRRHGARPRRPGHRAPGPARPAAGNVRRTGSSSTPPTWHRRPRAWTASPRPRSR